MDYGVKEAMVPTKELLFLLNSAISDLENEVA